MIIIDTATSHSDSYVHIAAVYFSCVSRAECIDALGGSSIQTIASAETIASMY